MTVNHPELTGDEKLALVRERIAAVRVGASTIECPYCGSVLEFPMEDTCCDKFTLATLAILKREQVDRQCEFADKIGAAWADMRAKGLIQ